MKKKIIINYRFFSVKKIALKMTQQTTHVLYKRVMGVVFPGIEQQIHDCFSIGIFGQVKKEKGTLAGFSFYGKAKHIDGLVRVLKFEFANVYNSNGEWYSIHI